MGPHRKSEPSPGHRTQAEALFGILEELWIFFSM